MMDEIKQKNQGRAQNRRVHMANERTFLAWIRTSIGIMAFGFVVEKFALFVRQMSLFLIKTGQGEPAPLSSLPSSPGSSSILGVVLIGLGAMMGLLAFIRYKKVERQIDEDTYQPSLILDILLTLAIVAIGVFMVIYLVHTF
jgi:putative membrane protein